MLTSAGTGLGTYQNMTIGGEWLNATKNRYLTLGLVAVLAQWAYVNSCPPPLLNANGCSGLIVDLRGMLG